MKKLLVISVFSFMFQLMFSQNTINETPILINKNHVTVLENILSISQSDLLNSEVDNGNLYLWVNENQLNNIINSNLEYITLKIAQLTPNSDKTDGNSGNRGVIPDLDPPTYTGDPTVGSEITLYLTGRNASYTSWSNDEGYITMTLPDFCNVNSFGGDSDWDGITKATCGTSIWTCNGNQISASDVIIDGYEDGWSIREARTIWAKVTPTQTGNLDIYTKMNIGDLYDPSGGCQGPDQQSWPVYQYYISITSTDYPDIIVEDIWTDPANPIEGESCNLYAKIKNIGNGIAENISWNYYIDGTYIDDDIHSSLNPGESRTEYEFGYIFTSPGNHQYKVSIDPVTNEQVTNNNDRTETVNVEVGNSPPTISRISPNSPYTCNVGVNVIFKAELFEPDGEGDFDRVEWRVNGTLLYTGTYNSITWSNPHTSVFNSTFNNPGSYTVEAKVFDVQGENDTVSWSVTVELQTYTITASSNPSNGGTTSGGGSYDDGTQCCVSATANTGYTFSHWEENGSNVSSSSSYCFTVSSNRNLVAIFTPIINSYTISTSSNPSNGGTTSGGGSYDNGVQCCVSATANTGYTFSHWEENGSNVSSNNPYCFSVSGDRSLVAVFTAISQITINTSSNPSNGGTTSGGGSYDDGTQCCVSATANTGYTFSHWEENGSNVSSSSSYCFTVSSNRNLVAIFTPIINSYTISTSSNPSNGGTTSGGGSYDNGVQCCVSATANTGYTFSHWEENGSNVSSNNPYCFSVSGDRSLVAVFTAISQPTITTSSSPSNGGTTSGGGSYDNGAQCCVSATANTGYTFSHWEENGSNVSSSSPYCFSVSGNRNLVAVFVDESTCIIQFQPSSQTVNTNTPLTTNLNIVNVQNLGGFELEISYDPTLLQATSISLGAFLESTGRTSMELANNIDNSNGLIEYAIATLGATPPGADGNGVLLTINWQSTSSLGQEMTADLVLQNVQVTQANASATLVPTTLEDGTVTIVPNAVLSADFSANPIQGTAPLTVQFTDMSTGNPTSWQWDFDNDGTIDSDLQDPEWTYNQAGTYSVSLTISDGTNSETELKTDYIIGDPSANNHFTPVWSGGAYQPMNILVSSASIDGLDVNIGDEIGIFDNDGSGNEICVGVGVVSQAITAASPLAIVAASDDPSTSEKDGFTSGNTIIYKAWANDSQTEYSNYLATYNPSFYDVFTVLGTALVEVEFQNTISQDISLNIGWNMMSFSVTPDDMNLLSIVDPIVISGELIKIIDEAGGFIQFIPGVGWMNTIGDMANTEGYYIKMSDNTNFIVTGMPVNLPFSIPLNTGWNIMSYPVDQSQNALTVLQPLIDDNEVVKVIDETGGFIQFIPGVGWMNTIGNFEEGEGYYIKVNTNTSLTLNQARTSSTDVNIINIPQSKYFRSSFDNNPYFPMNIIITGIDLFGNAISSGDEVAVYDGEYCVGVGVVPKDITQTVNIVASMDDPLTEDIDGYIENHNFSFKYMSDAFTKPLDMYFEKTLGSDKFLPLETFVGNLALSPNNYSDNIKGSDTFKLRVYPNPAMTRTNIEIDNYTEGNIRIEIINIYGKTVKLLCDEMMPEGKFNINYETSVLAAGIYNIKVIHKSRDGVLQSHNKLIITK